MKRFSFRLEKVLQLRRSAHDEVRRAFARECANLAEAERLLADSDAQVREAIALRDGGGDRQAGPVTLAGWQAVVEAARRWRDALALRRAEAEQRWARERARLVRCQQRLKVLENLRERREAEHLRSVAAQDVRVLDEIGIVRSRVLAEARFVEP